ncbi:MAG: hypothetical protein AB4050_03470 [Synechococcus sp.]
MSASAKSASQNSHLGRVLVDSSSPEVSQGRSSSHLSSGSVTFFVLSALLLMELLQWLFVYQIAKRPVPALVQLQDGTSMQVEEIARNERLPAAISSYVYTVANALFSATGTVPDGEGRWVEDRQFQLGDRMIATSAWAASHALSVDFPRTSMLEAIADITPPEVFDPNEQVEMHLEIRSLSEPKPVGEGQWQVDMVATRVITQRGMETDRLPFNKSIFVRAVEPYRVAGNPSATALAMQEYRSGGMEIYAIDGLRLEPIVESGEEP